MAENLTAQVELRALQAIADAVVSSRDLSVVSQRVAEAIAGGRSTRDVYVYVYDANTNELVLTGGTESPAARQVGNLRVAYGDGVTGWVAASRQSYLVADQPQLDPHFMAYPGIGEERWGAIFSVPIVSLGDDLLGCITVWATSGNRFDPDEVPFVERVAALIVGTFETARLLDSDRHYQQVSDGLAELASMVASDTSTAPTLDYATELARVAVGADIAIMLVTDPSGADRMYIKVAPTTDEHLRTTVDTARQDVLGVEQEIRNGRTSWHAASGKITQALERLTAAVSTAPIRVGSYELGIMACYRIESARFSNQEDATVATIANQAAVALKMTLLSDELYERNSLNWFLRDLSSGRESPEELRRRAASVGLDNGNRYLFVVGSVAAQPVTGVEVSSLSLGSGLKQLLMQIPEIPSDTQYATTPYQTVAVLPWHRDEDSIDA